MDFFILHKITIQFPITGSCTAVAGTKQNENWKLFCDRDGDDTHDAGESFITVVMNKKCKKIVSGPKTFSCGDSGKKSEIELNEFIYYANERVP